MNKKTLMLCCGFLCTAVSLNAQNSRGLIPYPAQNEPIRDFLLNTPAISNNSLTGAKPTADKQRLIASTISNDSTGAMMLKDTALYKYSGLRGSGPSGQTGLITVRSDFDTSYAYISTDNFAAPVPRSAQKYDAGNKLLFAYTYSPDAEVILRSWYEYYTTDTVKKAGNWRRFNATDYSYTESQFNEGGKSVIDTFSQVVPSIPGVTYNWDRVTKTEYDVQNRRISAKRRTNAYNAAGNVASGSNYDFWYFYNNATQMLPARDSAILVLDNSINSLLYQSYYTYNASGNLLELYTYIGDPQELNAHVVNTYNAAGKLLSALTENFNNGQLSYGSKVENEYSNNVLTLSKTSVWNSITGLYEEQSRTVYHLNSEDLVDSVATYGSALTSTGTITYNDFKNIVAQKLTTYDNNNIAHTSITHNYYEIFDDGTPETGVDNIHLDDLKVNMFPNPASGYIDINIQNWKGNAAITISTVNGNVLEKHDISSARSRMDLSSYTSGMYFIRIDSKGGTSIKKIVKQ